MDEAQCPAPPAALRAARSLRGAHTSRIAQCFDDNDCDDCASCTFMDSCRARLLLIQRTPLPDPEREPPLRWRVVRIPDNGRAVLPERGPILGGRSSLGSLLGSKGAPSAWRCLPWADYCETEQREILLAARGLLAHRGIAGSLRLISFVEEWRGGDGDERVQGLRLRGDLLRERLDDALAVLLPLHQRVSDLIVEVCLQPSLRALPTTGSTLPFTLTSVDDVLPLEPLASASDDSRRAQLLKMLFACPERDANARWARWMRAYFRRVPPSQWPPSPLRPSLSLSPPLPPVAARCSGADEPGGGGPSCVLSAQAPRVLLLKSFLSDEECDHMIRIGCGLLSPGADRGPNQSASGMLPAGARQTDKVVECIEQRIAHLTAIPVHPDEDELNLVFRPEGPPSDDGAPALVNLHMDAPLGRPFSAVTVLVYLNNVASGGGTCFPCINQERGLRQRYAHASTKGHDFMSFETVHVGGDQHELLCVAEHVARGTKGAGGLLTTPKRGCAIAFWSLNPLGTDASPHSPRTNGMQSSHGSPGPWSVWERERHAWHGGVRVLPGGGGKWILQKFKELPLEVRGNKSNK